MNLIINFNVINLNKLTFLNTNIFFFSFLKTFILSYKSLIMLNENCFNFLNFYIQTWFKQQVSFFKFFNKFVYKQKFYFFYINTNQLYNYNYNFISYSHLFIKNNSNLLIKSWNYNLKYNLNFFFFLNNYNFIKNFPISMYFYNCNLLFYFLNSHFFGKLFKIPSIKILYKNNVVWSIRFNYNFNLINLNSNLI